MKAHGSNVIASAVIIFCSWNAVWAQQWAGSTTTDNLITRNGNVQINRNVYGVAELSILNTNASSGQWSSYWKHDGVYNFDSQTRLLIANPNAGTGFTNGLYIGLDQAYDIKSYTLGSKDATPLALYTSGKERLTVNSSGTVSINKGEYGISELLISNTAENSGNYSSYWKDGTGGNADSQTRLLLKNPNAGTGFANGLYVGLDQAYSNKSYTIGTKDATPLCFYNTGIERFRISADGSVGIGTGGATGYKLAVAGKTITEEITVKLQATWPDYVFEKDYNLLPLDQLQTYIKENKHLPDVPSEAEVLKNGQDLGAMNAILLKKIEELTLYVIELEKRDTQRQLEIEAIRTATQTK